MIYHGGNETHRAAKKKKVTEDGDFEAGFKVERPGGYFGPFGPLIPAGGRLFLGLAERLFRDKGIPSYLICDTDAMCPAARPDSMSREDFQKAVLEVAGSNGWFQQLSPYNDGEQFFALEDVNYRLRDEISGEATKEFEPLDKETGARNYGAMVHGSTPRMLCDLWRIGVDCFREFPEDPKRALSKIDDIVGKLPQLQVPQYTQMALSSTHLMKLYPGLPKRRAFQFFATFPPPRCSIRSRDLLSVPLDEHRALCKTSLYASVPKEGVTAALIDEWRTTKTGLFRRDNNEFPHGLFNPEWKLRLETVAEALRGYFDHEEPKSVGSFGKLRRRHIVSLDKHFIGKETSPLDDHNEDAQDDEPITTSNDLVIRGRDLNLQPLIDAGIEFRKTGRRLTVAELKTIRNRTILHDNGTLADRGAVEDGYAHGYFSDPVWAARLKAWKELNEFGRFGDVAGVAGLQMADVEYVAKRWRLDRRC